MSIRAIDQNGDWVFGQGRSSYLTAQPAIAQDVKTRLLFFKNDFFAALAFGVDWWNLLSSKNPSAQNGILLQTRAIIIGTVAGYPSFGVAGINSVSVFLDARTRNINLQYKIRTIYSTVFSDQVTLSPAAQP
jgi:hypothetical protein